MASNVSSSDASETKCIITGLLTSNPKRTTIKQLCNDFLEMVGYPIPLDRLGFQHIEEYLQSMPDILQVYGTGPFAEVQGVIQEKSAHIHMLVAKQKRGKIHVPNKRRPVNFVHPNYYRSLQNFQPPNFQHLNYNTNQFQKKFVPHRSWQVHLGPNNLIVYDKNKVLESQVQTHVPPPEISKRNNVTVPNKFEVPKKFDTCNFLQLNVKKNTLETQSQKLPEEISKRINVIDKNIPETSQARLCKKIPEEISSRSNVEETVSQPHQCRVPMKVQNNLQNLILDFPKGVLCSTLSREYKSKFKRELSYDIYHYRSLIEMISDLPHIFQFRSISDDFLLFDKNAIDVSIEDHLKSSKSVVKQENVASTDVLTEIPLCDGLLGKLLIPPDVLQITDQIPRYFPADLKEGDVMEISIGEIYDLSKFWVYITFGDLEALMQNLQAFFTCEQERYIVPEFLLEEGLYCVSWFANSYHRCIIVNLLPNIPDSVRVFFIDYGTVENVYSQQVWFLPKKFAEAPCQAIRTRLSSICPVYENQPWSSEAIAKFEQLTRNSVVVAEVTETDETNHVVEVYLADITNKNNIFYINDVLVNEGFAIYSDQERKKCSRDEDCTPKVKFLHLHPEFYEIESGMAPTPEERKYIIENKVPLHHFMPQYFDISYPENIRHIITQHEKFSSRRCNVTFPVEFGEEAEFDFSYFPDCLQSEIRDLVQNNDTPTKTDEKKSYKEYSCNKKRRMELTQGSTRSELRSSSDNSSDDMSLDNSFNNLSLNYESTLNNARPSKSLNPFFSDIFNDTNPFRRTNPFLSDLDEGAYGIDSSEFFDKPNDDKLVEKIFNDLNKSPTKQTNIHKETNTSQNLLHSTPIVNKSDKSTKKNERKPVRPPPGFGPAYVQQSVPWNTSYMPNFSTLPYQFQSQAFNNSYCLPNLGLGSLGQTMGGLVQPNGFPYYSNPLYCGPSSLEQLQQLLRLQLYAQQQEGKK